MIFKAVEEGYEALSLPMMRKTADAWKCLNIGGRSRYFDTFDPEGNFIKNVQITGDVSFPARAIIKDGSFWLTQTDEEGLIKVVKFRISTGSV